MTLPSAINMLYPFVVALLTGLVIGGPVIHFLRGLKARQVISSDAPSSHQKKVGTPTMGGVIIVIAACFGAVAAFHRLNDAASQTQLTVLVLAFLAFGLIGFIDDLLIVLRGRNLGLRAREKFGLQIMVSVGFLWWFHRPLEQFGRPDVNAALLLVVMVLHLGILVGMSNAANLTDGLDGLAAGVGLPVWIGLAVLAAAGVPPVEGSHAVTIFCAAVAGASLGYLWYNAHPAQVFMGDTGSLALGGAMAAAAIIARMEWLMLAAAGVYVAEAFSVMLQVAYFKSTGGKRIFRRSPLHHHFEELGVPETRVVQRFIIVSVLLTGIVLWWALRQGL